MLIKEDFVVERLLEEFPGVISVFQKFKIEPTGKETIAQVCKENGVDISNFLIELNMAIERPDREGIAEESVQIKKGISEIARNQITPESNVSEMAELFPEIIPTLEQYLGNSNFKCKSFNVDFKTICQEQGVCLEDLLNDCNKKIRITREPILTEDAVIGDIVKAFPYLTKRVTELGLDPQEESELTLEEAAKKHKLNLDNLLQALNTTLKSETKL